jgi:hypothetical protein
LEVENLKDRIYVRIIPAEKTHLVTKGWVAGHSRSRSEDRCTQYQRLLQEFDIPWPKKYAIVIEGGPDITLRQIGLFHEKYERLIQSFISSIDADLPGQLQLYVLEHCAAEFSRLRYRKNRISKFPSLNPKQGELELALDIDSVGMVVADGDYILRLIYHLRDVSVVYLAAIPYDMLSSFNAFSRLVPVSVSFLKARHQVDVVIQKGSL